MRIIENIKKGFLRKYWPYLSCEINDIDAMGGHKILQIIIVSLRHLYTIFLIAIGAYVVIPYVEIVITTKCSLRCKYCSNLMQYYSNETVRPYDVSLETNMKSIEELLDLVNQINNFTILGGEPFLYKDLDSIVDCLTEKNKVKIVTIITNGTLLPDPNILESMKNRKVHVVISDYGNLSRKRDELVELFDTQGISYEIRYTDGDWLDFGNLAPRKRTNRQLEAQFRNCKTQCKSILNGRLHYCFRSTHAMDLKRIQDNKEEYLDLFSNGDKKQKKEKLRKLLYAHYRYIAACDYCDYASDDVKKNKTRGAIEKRGKINMSNYWENRAKKVGHTGYVSSVAYAYDQLIRLKIVDEIIRAGGYFGGNQKTCCLDFGCGTGDFSIHEEQLFDKFVLYDISSTVLEGINLKKENEIFSDFDRLSSSTNTFDCIICITVLEHILDKAEFNTVLDFMHDRLKNKGIFILIMLLSDEPDTQYMKSWKLDELLLTLERFGFDMVNGWDLYENGLVNDEGFNIFRKRPDIRLLGKIYPYMPEHNKNAIRRYMSSVVCKDIENKRGKDFLFPLSRKQGHKVMVLTNENISNTKKI